MVTEFGIRRAIVLPVLDGDSDIVGAWRYQPDQPARMGFVAVALRSRAADRGHGVPNGRVYVVHLHEATDWDRDRLRASAGDDHPYSQNRAHAAACVVSPRSAEVRRFQYQAHDWRDPDGDPLFLKNAEDTRI